MKILKPLLWFLVPTIVIWATYFLIGAFIGSSSDAPRFAGYDNYLRLFIQDDIFLTALGNALMISFLPSLVICVVVYFITAILKVKSVVMFSAIFVTSSLTAMFAKFLIFDLNFYISLFDVLASLQFGIICCFICFLINIIFKRFIKKETAE